MPYAASTGSSAALGTRNKIMDGQAALEYVRQGIDAPGGAESERVRRQQEWIRAVLSEVSRGDTLADPQKLSSVLEAFSQSISADNAFTLDQMRSLASSLTGLQSADVAFITAPVKGQRLSPDGKLSIVELDAAADAQLWQAMTDDTMLDWVSLHAPTVLSRPGS